MNKAAYITVTAVLLFVAYFSGVSITKYNAITADGRERNQESSKASVTPTLVPEVTTTITPTVSTPPTPILTPTQSILPEATPTSEVRYVYKEKKVYTTVMVTPTPTPIPVPHVVYWKIIRIAEAPIVGDICRYPASTAENGDLTIRRTDPDYPNIHYPDLRFPTSGNQLLFSETLQTEVLMQCYDVRYLNTTYYGYVSFKRGENTSSDVIELGGYVQEVESGEREGLDDNWTDWLMWWPFNG